MKRMNETELIKEYNKTKDKNLLPNKGLRTEKNIYSKELKIGYDRASPIYLECSIKEVDLSTEAIYVFDSKTKDYILKSIGNTKKDIFLNDVFKYYMVSFSAYSENFAGQCYDTLLNDESIKLINPEYIKRIIELWKMYHLNDLTSGCYEQEKVIEEYLKSNEYDYEKVCDLLKEKGLYNYKNYKYGSAWLVKTLKESEILFIIETLNNYESVKK